VLEIRKTIFGKHIVIIDIPFDEEVIVTKGRIDELKSRLRME